MQEINLYDLIKFYGKKWRVIAALTFAGLLAGLAYNTFIQVPMYKSNAKLLLVSSQTTQTATTQTLLNNYIDLIQSRRVLEPVILRQNNAISYDKLVKSVSAVNQKDTAVIDLNVTTTNPKQSSEIANEITDSFKSAVNDLYQSSGVIVVDSAVESTTPINVNKSLQASVTTVVGFLISIVTIFIMFDFNKSYSSKGRKDIPAGKKTSTSQFKKSQVLAKKVNRKQIINPAAKKINSTNIRKR